MVSKYYEIKTQTKEFDESILNLINELQGKKVIIYGAGAGFVELNKKYKFNEVLNVVAIADRKFSDAKEGLLFENIKTIAPQNVSKEEYDVILITNETTSSIISYLINELEIDENKIKKLFNGEIPDETFNLNYLYEMKFDKTLPKLVKKLNGKTVILYGAGAFLELIKAYFDLSGLNIIGISDRKFAEHKENEEWGGYKAYSPDEIKDLKPDYVLVATKFYVNIIEDMYYNTLKDTNIKIKPLLKKPFLTLVKEIWG